MGHPVKLLFFKFYCNSSRLVLSLKLLNRVIYDLQVQLQVSSLFVFVNVFQFEKYYYTNLTNKFKILILYT